MTCKACGYCCSKWEVTYPNNPVQNEFMYARGFSILQRCDEFIQWVIDLKCPQLKGNKCRIYDKRPEACKRYPFSNNYAPFGLDNNKAIGDCKGYKWDGEKWKDK